jgi:hypothetical protein
MNMLNGNFKSEVVMAVWIVEMRIDNVTGHASRAAEARTLLCTRAHFHVADRQACFEPLLTL